MDVCFQEPEILQPQSNEILTAIVHGMKKEEPRYVSFCVMVLYSLNVWYITLSAVCLFFSSLDPST